MTEAREKSYEDLSEEAKGLLAECDLRVKRESSGIETISGKIKGHEVILSVPGVRMNERVLGFRIDGSVDGKNLTHSQALDILLKYYKTARFQTEVEMIHAGQAKYKEKLDDMERDEVVARILS